MPGTGLHLPDKPDVTGPVLRVELRRALRDEHGSNERPSRDSSAGASNPTVINEVWKGEQPMKLRPLHDRVIVKRVEEERTTPGGIVIPDSAAEKPIKGEVLAVGNGKILEDGSKRELDIKVGDTVLFGKYSGTEVKVEGDELLVMREDDIMAVIES